MEKQQRKRIDNSRWVIVSIGLMAYLLLCMFVFSATRGQWTYQHKPPLGQQINWAHPLSDFIGAWFFLEGSGSQVFDLSGNGNTGTFFGSTTWGSGKFGPAISMGGSDEYIRTDHDIDAITVNVAYSISLWANFPDYAGGTDGFLMSQVKGSGDRLVCILYGSATNVTVGFMHWNGSDWNVYQKTNVIPDVWHHFVFVRFADMTAKIYIDGVDVGSAGGSTTSPGSSAADYLVIGSNIGGGADWYNGLLDMPLIYNRALVASEIAQLSFMPFEDSPVVKMFTYPAVDGVVPTPYYYRGFIPLPFIFFTVYYLRRHKCAA